MPSHRHRVDAECLAGQDPVSTKKGKPPISYIENIKKSLGLNLQNITMRVRTGIDGVILWIEHHVGQQPSQPMMLTDDR